MRNRRKEKVRIQEDRKIRTNGRTLLLFFLSSFLIFPFIAGCTFTLEDPSVKNKIEQTEQLVKRIEMLKLLEEESRLIHSLALLKEETAMIQAGRVKAK